MTMTITKCPRCGGQMWEGPPDEPQRPCYPCQVALRQAAEQKACGCHVGFCRASILLDGAGDAVMDGNERMARELKEAYDKLAPKCVGGWRAIPPREG
jgi:hypothetical protein